MPKVFRVIGSIVAPATLLTALLLYFGRLHATGVFRYFGVEYTVLDLTAQDYLVRSADGMIVPLVVVAGVVLIALWGHQFLTRAVPISVRRNLSRILAPLSVAVGLALVWLAIIDTIGQGVFVSFPEGRGLSLSIGALLLAYGAHLARLLTAEGPPVDDAAGSVRGNAILVEWGAVFILVSIGLFWAVGTYAVGVGEARGRQFEAALPGLPDVTLHAERSLGIEEPGVSEMRCQDLEADYRFRYDGLRMMLQSGDHYLLLPAEWQHGKGSAILIPRADTVSLEFRPAGQVRPATC